MASSVKPKSITSFNRFNLVTTLVGITNIIGHYTILRNLAISNGSSPASPILGVIFLVISYLLFWIFVYRRGSNIAKWLFVAVTTISIAMIPFNVSSVAAIGLTYLIFDGIAFALQIAAMAMLFQRDAKVWLTQQQHQQANP